MRKALVKDGLVVNVIEVDPNDMPADYAAMPDAPAHVGPGFAWDGTTFTAPAPPPVSIEEVKAAAERLILALCPEWKQRNLTAQAVILAKKGAANWTAEEQAAWDAGEALWAQIKAIRDSSDQIEAMVPIPQDFSDRLASALT